MLAKNLYARLNDLPQDAPVYLNLDLGQGIRVRPLSLVTSTPEGKPVLVGIDGWEGKVMTVGDLAGKLEWALAEEVYMTYEHDPYDESKLVGDLDLDDEMAEEEEDAHIVIFNDLD